MILSKLKKEPKVSTDDNEEKDEKNQENGGRNLCLLGLGALIIAIITTSISLKIYHDTGDIYLDRSRPGFISEDEKNNKDDTTVETFSSDGEINAETLEEYLESLSIMREKVDAHDDDFAADPLSDLQLGIEVTEEPVEDSVEESTEN